MPSSVFRKGAPRLAQEPGANRPPFLEKKASVRSSNPHNKKLCDDNGRSKPKGGGGRSAGAVKAWGDDLPLPLSKGERRRERDSFCAARAEAIPWNRVADEAVAQRRDTKEPER